MKGKTKSLTLFIAVGFFLASVIVFSPDISSQPAETTCNGCADCSSKLNGSFSQVNLTADILNYNTTNDPDNTCITFSADNIIFNGNSHLIDGVGVGNGIDLNGFSGLTVKNVEITEFENGIYSIGSNYVNIENNNIHHNIDTGIFLGLGGFFSIVNNFIESNGISGNIDTGIFLSAIDNNVIISNIIVGNYNGIKTNNINNNNIIQNVIASNNNYGIAFSLSNNNSIYYNNIISNANQVIDINGNNFWHNGYPEGGNYWSDVAPTCADDFSGPNQSQLPGGDGICDQPFYNSGDLEDTYPWVNQSLIDYIPVIEPVTDIVAAVNNTVMIILNASDPNNNTLTYYINDTRFSQSDPSNNTFTWQTNQTDIGNYTFAVWVNDGTYNAVRTVNVEVIDAFSVHHFIPVFIKENYTSTATALMILSYVGNNTATQDEIYNYGFQYNLPQNNATGNELDPKAMDYVLGHFDPYDGIINQYNQYDYLAGGNPYEGYNFVPETYTDVTDYMRDISHWMDYKVPLYWGSDNFTNVSKVPPAVPLFGNYSNWVVVNGFAASADPLPDDNNPFFTPNFNVSGFWLTDPNTEGIGVNRFVTADIANSTYFRPIVSTDIYNGKYVQIAEPPEVKSSAKVMIEKTKKNTKLSSSLKDELINAAGSFNSLTGMAVSVNERKGKDKLKLKDIDWESITPSYLLRDPLFSEAFENTKAEEYILVKSSDTGDYYIINFEKKSKDRDKDEKDNNEKNKKGKVSVSLIIEDDFGTFREAAWVKEPQEYKWLTEKDAVKKVKKYLEETGKFEILMKMLKERKYRAEFNWEPGDISTSPFEPYWKVTVGYMVFYVKHNGDVIPGNMFRPVMEVQPLE